MCKRKEAEVLSDSSEIFDPEKGSSACVPGSSSGIEKVPDLKKQKRSKSEKSSYLVKNWVTAENPGIVCDVQLNGEPFYHFFAKEIKDTGATTVSESDHKIEERNVCNLSLSLLLPYYSDSTPVINPKTDSDKGKKVNSVSLSLSIGSDQNPKTPERNVSDVSLSPSLSYPNHTSDRGASVNSLDSGTEISTASIAPIQAVPLKIYNPNENDVVVINPPQEVNWTIRKVLTGSDCNAQHRLLLKKKSVEDHIMTYLNEADRDQINTLNGLRVQVWDCDKRAKSQLTLKKWASSQCYGLMDNWKKAFVKRRELEAGDEVGLAWDADNNRLLFTLLAKKV